MGNKELKAVLDEHTHFEVDNRFVTKVMQYVQRFINKNDNHTEFFGGNLLGVNSVSFGNTRDGGEWLQEVLDIDDTDDLQKDIYECHGILRDAHVAPDAITISFVYTAYRILNSSINVHLREEAVKSVLFIMQARWITGIMKKRFPHPADPSIALALYESLDNRTDLKMHGSWYALITARSEQILDKQKGIHRDVFTNFDSNEEYVTAINDLDTRWTKMFNELTQKFHQIKDSQSRIISQSPMSEIDGEKTLRDFSGRVQNLINDIDYIAQDPRDFIRAELIGFTKDAISTCNVDLLEDTLKYYTDNYRANKEYPVLLRNIVTYVYNLSKDSYLDLSDIEAIVKRVRSVYRAAGTRQKEILDMKQVIKELVEDAIPKAHDIKKVPTNISFFMYVVLRILTVKRYR